MNSVEPYGFTVVFRRAKPNTGLSPEIENVSLRRKGKERVAIRAAKLSSGFTEIVSLTPIPAESAPKPYRHRIAGHLEESDNVSASVNQALTLNDFDDAFSAITTAKRQMQALVEMARQKQKLLDGLTDNLRAIERLIPEPGVIPSGSTRLLTRCARLQELFNMEELGSFGITVNDVMDQAWRRMS